MKLKARQIISGWPRGRSSSRPIRIPTWFQFAFYKSLLDKRSSPIVGPSDADFEQFTRTNVILFFEAEEEAKYRAGQDTMTDSWRRVNGRRRMEQAERYAIDATYGQSLVEQLIPKMTAFCNTVEQAEKSFRALGESMPKEGETAEVCE